MVVGVVGGPGLRKVAAMCSAVVSFVPSRSTCEGTRVRFQLTSRFGLRAWVPISESSGVTFALWKMSLLATSVRLACAHKRTHATHDVNDKDGDDDDDDDSDDDT